MELRDRWNHLLPDAKPLGEDLLGRYSEPHRVYHDQRHLTEVLDAVDELAGDAEDPDTIRLAAWFHDAVYDPRATDNEERSAHLAASQLASLGWEPGRCAFVAGLVSATAGHLDGGGGGGEAVPLEQQVLLDADLAVLGAEPAAYAAYVNGVRSEYGHLTPHEWADGRSQILRRLLGRAALYATAPARSWWDARARANLTAELAGLRDEDHLANRCP
jgi:predicted metal-dependent HD superfamily phosphohydrolase